MPDGSNRMRHADTRASDTPLEAVIIGAGFGGLAMAVALKRAGIERFVLLEKGDDVGGAWRENVYPGAGCDVPSHLYSFSFRPNPRWSRMFARQPEILDYLRDCADAEGLRPHIRLRTPVEGAEYEAAHAVWRVILPGGESLRTRLLVSSVGLLSRPAMPRIPGRERLAIPAFHSALWDDTVALDGKRVGVVGTGASAIQFVPEIAKRAGVLKVFQRSPPYIIPRPDRPYTAAEKARFARHPWIAKLHRARIYTQYESRALAFTRFGWLMKIAVGVPFRLMLRREIRSPDLRARLTPDYPIGCKRILLSNEYYPALARPNVELIDKEATAFTTNGVETADGAVHELDAIIYGTGFTATEFLSPMRIVGRDGVDLATTWRDGASAYLGLSVPNFPNFFMLYGPNTNLGHNSIITMLESQVAHVMRCVRRMRDEGATSVEIAADRHERRDRHVQRRLARTVWAGCTSWYVDATGRNSTNWPGFTFTYWWLTRHGSLDAYRFSREVSAEGAAAELLLPPAAALERATASFLRLFLRAVFRAIVGPPMRPVTQRRVVGALAPLMPGAPGTRRSRVVAGGVRVVVVRPREQVGAGAILYLHGGAYVLGNPRSHRAVTTRLALASGLPVWVPDYRLAPEAPYPAAIDDALSCWRALRASGLGANRIVIAGDSAGGGLALALALRLKQEGETPAAGLALISPVTDPGLTGATLVSEAGRDPMVRRDWLAQGLGAYAIPASAAEHHPLAADLSGLPPMLIQVGDEEILLSDSTRLAARARDHGVACRLEIHAGRWHVFHLQATMLASARSAIRTLGAFAATAVRASGPQAQLP